MWSLRSWKLTPHIEASARRDRQLNRRIVAYAKFLRSAFAEATPRSWTSRESRQRPMQVYLSSYGNSERRTLSPPPNICRVHRACEEYIPLVRGRLFRVIHRQVAAVILLRKVSTRMRRRSPRNDDVLTVEFPQRPRYGPVHPIPHRVVDFCGPEAAQGGAADAGTNGKQSLHPKSVARTEILWEHPAECLSTRPQTTKPQPGREQIRRTHRFCDQRRRLTTSKSSLFTGLTGKQTVDLLCHRVGVNPPAT